MILKYGAYGTIGIALGLAFTAIKRERPEILGITPAAQPAVRCSAIDGDTLRCGDQTIRLLGVDSAELPGHCRRGRECAPGDPEAQKAAFARFARSPLLISPIKKDRYGRTVAIVKNKAGENASCVMIEAGALYVSRWDHNNAIAIACSLDFIRNRHRLSKVNDK